MPGIACPYCGSLETIWDYKNGYVVCSRCGYVLDKIYDMHAVRHYYDDSTSYDNQYGTHACINTYSGKLVLAQRRTKKYFSLVKSLKDKDKFTIHIEAGIASANKRVKTIIRKDTLRLIEVLRRKSEIAESLKEIDTRYPRLASRTERVRIAAAMMLLMIRNGEDPAKRLKEIAKNTGISMVHARRILRIFKSYRLLRN